MKKYLALILFATFYSNAQVSIDFEPFSLGDNQESFLFKEIQFELDEVPTFLIIECVTGSINPFNEYQSLINNRLIKGNIDIDHSGSYFTYFDSEAKNYTIVNAQYKDENDQWQTTGKLVYYVPNSFLLKGKNTITFLNEDNDQRYMDDYFVNKITLYKISRKPLDLYKDYRCNNN